MTVPRLLIGTAVWGEWHLDVLRDLVMPSLLPNLADLCARLECQWEIQTTPEFQARCEEIAELARGVIFVSVNPRLERDCAHYKNCWKDIHIRAWSERRLAMFLPPDVVWSKDSFAGMAEQIRSGKDTVFVAHPRGRKSAFDGFDCTARTGEELMRIVAEHNHVLNRSNEYGSERFTQHPEMIIWPVRNGYVVRLFAREVFVCDPREVSFNEVNLPNTFSDKSFYIVRSSDEACGVSIAKDEHDADNYRKQESCNEGRVAAWLHSYPSPSNAWLSMQPVVWRYGELDEKELDTAINASQRFAADVQRLRA